MNERRILKNLNNKNCFRVNGPDVCSTARALVLANVTRVETRAVVTQEQARTGITTNVAVPQRPVRKTALGAGMVVDGGRLEPSSSRSSWAGPYFPLIKFRRGSPLPAYRGPVHGLPHY